MTFETVGDNVLAFNRLSKSVYWQYQRPMGQNALLGHAAVFLSLTITSILSCGYVYAEGYNCRVIKGSQLSLQLPTKARLHSEREGATSKQDKEEGRRVREE